MKPLLLFLIAALASAQGQTGSISGTVIDSVTKQPISKATLSLVSPQSNPQLRSNTPPGTVATNGVLRQAPGKSFITDLSGHFSMDQLPPGAYQLSVRHQNYPESRAGRVAKTVVVQPSQETGLLTFELAPGASVSGTVTDEDGDPLVNCNVTAESPGARSRPGPMMGVLQNTQGFDDGKYRIYGIAAGKYLLSAQCRTPVFQPRPLSAGPDPPPSAAYPKQLYPEPVDLTPGVERTGIDFRMKPVPVTHIQVTLGPGAEWRGRKGLAWRLEPIDSPDVFTGWRDIDTSKPAFDIPQVFPGSYRLIVISRGTGQEPLVGAVQRIDAGDRPLETMLSLRNGVNLNGTVEFEGSNDANRPPLSQVGIQLGPDFQAPFGFAINNAHEDGTFTANSVFPGPVRLRVNVQSAFMKSAWLGTTEVIGGLLDLSSGAGGNLRIVLSTNTASVHGTAPPGAMVWINATEPDRFQNTRSTQADQAGQFKLDGLAPGQYRLSQQPPGPATQGGNEITLVEGQTLMAELKPEPNQ